MPGSLAYVAVGHLDHPKELQKLHEKSWPCIIYDLLSAILLAYA
jgi:hypothetical protein